MSKTYFLSRVTAICLAIVLIAGFGFYACPRLAQILNGQTVDWSISWPTPSEPLTEFEEQTLLQQEYENTLETDIVSALEQITGRGTVQATVRAQLNLEKTKEIYKKSRYTEQSDRIAGVVEDLSVSVLIDGQMVTDRFGRPIYQPRSKADMKQYTDIVKTIIGFNIGRGDHVSVQNVPFANPERYIGGISLSAWINGFLFLLLLGLVVCLLGTFLLPLMWQITHIEDKHLPKGTDILNKVLTVCRHHPDRVINLLKSWMQAPDNRRNPRIYTLPEKAAIFVLGIGQSEATRLLSNLSDPDVKKIGKIMSRLGRVSASDIRATFVFFLKQYNTPLTIIGNPEKTRDFLVHTRPNGQQLFSEIQLTDDGQTVWDRFSKLEMGQIISFIQRQKPETASLILFHLSDDLSGRILTVLPSDFSAKILIHLTHIRQIRPEVIQRLSGQIAAEVYALLQQQGPTGSDKITAILKTLSDREKDGLLQKVERLSPTTAKGVKSGLKEWTDILTLSEVNLRKLLKYSSVEVLSAAICGEPIEIQSFFAKQLTPSAWQAVQEKMGQEKGNKPAAQSVLLRTARELKLFG